MDTLMLDYASEDSTEVGRDSGEESDDPQARPTNWRAIMIPARDWDHMEDLQNSIMAGATGHNAENLTQAGRNKRVDKLKAHWKTISLDQNVIVVITVHASTDGFYYLKSIADTPEPALKALLGDHLLHVQARRDAYFALEQGEKQVGETWGVLITCATGLQNFAWREQLTNCLSSWRVIFDEVIALFTLPRFTHSLLTHDQTVMVDIATRVVAHFLSLVIWDTQGERSREFERYVDILAKAMFATEHRMGMALIHREQIALLRWGNFTSRPFGQDLRPCKAGETCNSGRKFVKVGKKGPFGTRHAFWDCETHGRVAQPFPSALVGWWLADSAGHLARWSELLPAPPPM